MLVFTRFADYCSSSSINRALLQDASDQVNMSKFMYDPLDLIELIEQRPCIWDKTCDDYKDKLKKNAWTEVYNFLIENYENLDDSEKLTAGKAVSDKWKHIRDAFSLSLKKKSGDKRSKKYIYFEQLQFLMKILKKDDTVSTTSSDIVSTTSRSRKRKNTSTLDATDIAILKALEATAQPSADIDEDAGFFASITPYVKKFNEDQKLTFRMGVMTLIQQIKNQNTGAPRPPSSDPSTSSYSSYGGSPSQEYQHPMYMADPRFEKL